MDKNVFFSEDREYKIRVSKQLKFYSTSIFGQYNCSIEFLNSMNFPVLQINCTEKELYRTIMRISEFSTNIGMGITENDNAATTISFESGANMSSFFWYLYTTNLDAFPDYPVEHDINCQLCIYSGDIHGSSLRLFLDFTYQYLDILIYEIYKILEDIPYLDEMNNSIITDFLQGEYDGE